MNLGPRLHFLRSIHRLLTLRDGILHQPKKSGSDDGVIDVDKPGQNEVKMESTSELQRSAEAMWLFKVAEEEHSFR